MLPFSSRKAAGFVSPQHNRELRLTMELKYTDSMHWLIVQQAEHPVLHTVSPFQQQHDCFLTVYESIIDPGSCTLGCLGALLRSGSYPRKSQRCWAGTEERTRDIGADTLQQSDYCLMSENKNSFLNYLLQRLTGAFIFCISHQMQRRADSTYLMPLGQCSSQSSGGLMWLREPHGHAENPSEVRLNFLLKLH